MSNSRIPIITIDDSNPDWREAEELRHRINEQLAKAARVPDHQIEERRRLVDECSDLQKRRERKLEEINELVRKALDRYERGSKG